METKEVHPRNEIHLFAVILFLAKITTTNPPPKKNHNDGSVTPFSLLCVYDTNVVEVCLKKEV